jgi:glycine hydroxymethyltransferase
VPRLRHEFRAYAAAAAADNARTLVEGPAAEGLRPVSGGTDTHLALVDLRGAE